mmetsp:Transcript_4735/g.6127  ORF Transcript_4735/g.6127 Transcript_4735/m.6127 type:complete len:251 (-) Transcript_4735:112-864(-)
MAMLFFLQLCFYIPMMVQAFTIPTTLNAVIRGKNLLLRSAQTEWQPLIEEIDSISDQSPVKKMILQEGTGPLPSKGSKVEISYVGKLGASQDEWSVEDVLQSWLQNQQGLFEILSEPFREMNVNGKILMEESVFTEEFVTKLGVSNKIQCKKTIMAAKRLWKQSEEFPEGFQFDSSEERGTLFKFILGGGKVIKAMDIGVSTMKVGEKARILCRSDYGYGSEGYRKKTGEVVVPPFRTLSFDIELISSSS